VLPGEGRLLGGHKVVSYLWIKTSYIYEQIKAERTHVYDRMRGSPGRPARIAPRLKEV
jgi:hypothetical protein